MTGKNSLTKHHIICRSKGGTDDAENIALVKRKYHEKYHSLFENRNPDEILDFLVNYFWNGQNEHVEKYLKSQMHLQQFNDLFMTGEVK